MSCELEDLAYVWPDGTWCYRDDLAEYLTFMSDDYDALTWEEFEEQYPEEME